MKTIKKMTLIVLMLVTTLSYAGKRKIRSFSKVTMVEFVNAKKGQELLVKDKYGSVLHSETVKDNGKLSKWFDLNELENGNYSIELEKDFEIIVKSFEIKNNEVLFLKNGETKSFKPVIKTKNNKLLVSQLSLESNPIHVEIYYEDSLIYTETLQGEKTLNRIYSLSKAERGDYHTVIKTNNRTFVKYFEL
ncbi:hypothetical protein [Psychroserpens ponticola]|uniref:Uncharacterized protein n=1 Tax=Psychroserpens ponticola TaxID=2932268 RepID=A0ABY7RWW1_9FLAO|nr:hypothetical protein [Psychroserpens ponticola]WCO01567.1 hypothetical protein MUN68_016060 [Psychroserpens ponticola]